MIAMGRKESVLVVILQRRRANKMYVFKDKDLLYETGSCDCGSWQGQYLTRRLETWERLDVAV